jgi:hypothetical protein
MTGTWDRVQELMDLQAGWLDGAGAKPEPRILLRAGVLAEAIPTERRVRIYPSEDGGVNLEWDDVNLLHCITIGPDMRLDLMTVDKDVTP